MQVAVTGATGFVGRQLVQQLLDAGHVPVPLSRAEVDPLDPARIARAIRGCRGVVNLQGENLFGRRWRAAVKADLVSSRVTTTEALVEAFRQLGREAPAVLVSASAVGFYGPREPDQVLDETAPQGGDFLAGLCAAWEQAALGACELGTRVVVLRIGAVLGAGGGALAAMEGPFRFFVGGPVGSGKQIMSWIDLDDLCRLVRYALANETLAGPVNATAPFPVSNRMFAKALGRALGRPSWARVPGPVLRLTLGEVATVVTAGQDVRPARALAAGFSFERPTVDESLAAIYGGPDT